MFGAYNRNLGESLNEVMKRHEPVLRDHFEQTLMMNLGDILDQSSVKGSVLEFDEVITAPFFGYESQDDYYTKAACVHRIPKIKTPTLFMNSLDDPIIGSKAIDYEVFRDNENCVLGVNKNGGHLGYHESIFGFEVWFMKPVLAFLGTFRE
uniref:Uncharacterized protein n=1 Tax=Strombidium inclinatum TaxID=197538 RepID=A0A7S3IKC8_9SPIT|mmetsp:Transcript_24576/g.38133  ORF Transcript_24576/g.38133 Transcript_24576/m.38133 type:complete len:151 (+) Transcript_24576:454-906(+)